ncbi:IS66 family insertion sequence element accessory protein TnpB [Sorangium sp. So ce1000]
MVSQRVGADPLCGHLFVFRNRRGDQVRVLFWDRTGYMIVAKNWPAGDSISPATCPRGPPTSEVEAAELSLMLEGLDLSQAVRRKRWRPGREKNCSVEAKLDGCAWDSYLARHVTSPLQSQEQLPADLADVRRKLEQLAAAGQLPELIELVLGLLVQLRDKNTALSARLASALRELYGRKSQHVSTEQLILMFAELGAEAPPGTAGSELGADAPPQPEQGLVPQPPEPPKPPRGRGGRAELGRRPGRARPRPRARRTVLAGRADELCLGRIGAAREGFGAKSLTNRAAPGECHVFTGCLCSKEQVFHGASARIENSA